MNRRGFLSGLFGLGVGIALPEPTQIVVPDPPRVRTYSFLPAAPLLVAAQLNQTELHRAIFKGGILKIAIKIKGWEMPGDWQRYASEAFIKPHQ